MIFFILAVRTFAGSGISTAADSSKAIISKFVGGLNFSILNSSNWQGVDYSSFSFSGDAEYNFIKSREISSDYLNLKFELGVTRIFDSTWYKHADNLNSQYIFKSGRKRTSQTAMCLLNAKLLNSYIYSIDGIAGSQTRKRSGSFFNPSSFETGYGIGYTFLKQSILNFSLATARIRIINKNEIVFTESIIPLSKFNKSSLVFDYGFSLQYNILHDLTKVVSFYSSGKMFLKGIDSNKVEMDLSQKWIIKLTEYFQLKTDVKIVYAPLVSHKMQFRNEFLFGFFFNTSVKK